MASKLKIALVGAGLVGKRHAEVISRSPNWQMAAIVDPNPEASALAAQFDVPHYQELEPALDAIAIDGVLLATPTMLHVAQGRMCIEREIPVLIEKPLAVSAKDALDLVEQAEAKNVPILVGHHRRHNPLIQRAKTAIVDGDVGDIRTVSGTCWFYKPDEYFETAPWRTQKGAGPISVNLVHDVDLIRYLVGEVISVQAQAAPSKRGFENEDVAAAVLVFDTGAIGTITVSDSTVSPWSWELTSGEYPIYPKTQQSSYIIGGSAGALSVPDLTLWQHEDRPDWWSPINNKQLEFQPSDPLVNQIEHFADVVRRDGPPLVSGREGFKTLCVIEAIQNAAKDNKLITLRQHADV